jgi:hypothetical protein
MQTGMTKNIVTFLNFVKLPKIATIHTTNRPPLAVPEGKSVMDKFLIPKLQALKIENVIIFVPTLKDPVYITFPEVVPNIFQELFR